MNYANYDDCMAGLIMKNKRLAIQNLDFWVQESWTFHFASVDIFNFKTSTETKQKVVFFTQIWLLPRFGLLI